MLAVTAVRLLFALLLWMPVTGVIGSTLAGYPVKLFNLVATPQFLRPDARAAALVMALHDWGRWPLYALIVLHIAAVAFHIVWARTGILARMLPPGALGPLGD